MNPARGAKLGQVRMLWDYYPGQPVRVWSSLICDHWLTRKLVTFMGSTDSWSARFSWHDVRLWLRGWTYSEPARRGLGPSLSPVGLDLQWTSEWEGGWQEGAAAQAGRMSHCAVHLHSLGREHNLGLKSFLVIPSRLSNAKPVGSHYL